MILATRNGHKIREFAEILPAVDLRALPDGLPSPEETGETFAENALIKARAAHEATGEPAIADDSGLVVDGLGGQPGVRSARYAGDGASDGDNLTKVLDELAKSGGDPAARYVCVVAYVDETGAEHLFEATCEGRMTPRPRGTGGFGYDPAFIPEDTGSDDERTMAELSAAEKHAISHRGRAVRQLAEHLAT